MPGPLDHIAFLSQEVGPRPAGTEEEQRAALYITEQLQKEAGLSAVIEDFHNESNAELPCVLCAFCTLLFTILALFFSVMAIPALVIAAIAAILYTLETLDRPLLSKLFARGVSQNVVAKYEPTYSAQAGGSRRRKIIVCAHYDSGKVRPELKVPLVKGFFAIRWISLAAMVIMPIFLLIRSVFFLDATDTTALILNSVTGILLVFIALPIILALVHKFSAYNEAANCNASGVAVLLDVARQIAHGKSGDAKVASREDAPITIHGEEAARSAGLAPEGVSLVYNVTQDQAAEVAPQTEEDRLLAAKAAIAAMTGQPEVSPKKNLSVADNLVQVKDTPLAQPTEEAIEELREEIRGALSQGSVDLPQEERNQTNEEPLPASQGSFSEGTREDSLETPHKIQDDAPKEESIPTEEPSLSAQETEESSVPDWFKKAQANAKKPKESKAAPSQRSRYADALDAAVAESSSYFSQANRIVDTETEERLKKMRDGIMEVSAPHRVSEKTSEQPETQKEDSSEAAKKQELPLQNILGATKELTAQEGNDATQMMPFVPDHTIEMQAATENNRPSFLQADTGENRAEEGTGIREKRQPITLPDVGVSTTSFAPLDEDAKQQRAPLAIAEKGTSQSAAKSLLTMLPSIEVSEQGQELSETRGGVPEKQAHPDLRTTLPSLSGVLKIQGEQSEGSDVGNVGGVSAAGSFTPAGATGAFAPVGNELLENVDPDDIYVEDADDSEYEENFTETGAFAGPGYVEMPQSRARRFLDKFSFRKKKNNEEVTAQEWLDIEEEFDARSVGAARGGWESFQGQSTDDAPTNNTLEDETYFERNTEKEKKWEGGAFSVRTAKRDTYDQNMPDSTNEDTLEHPFHDQSFLSEEIEQIQQFHASDFPTEVWFVALGSELAHNGGMRAFLDEHKQDLRGSVIINLEALGAGELSFLEKEGFGKKAIASSRLKRYIKKASQKSGITIKPTHITWKESAATVATKQGFQAVSIAGMEGIKPAYFAQGDDVFEHIEEEKLQEHVRFIADLLHMI